MEDRRYPRQPVVGVGAVVFLGEQVVLVKRAQEPLKDRWSLPGGRLEVGETMREGIAREVREETGLDVRVGPVVDVFDRIVRDADGRPEFHYVLIDFLCWSEAGALVARSDASEVALADLDGLEPFGLAPKTIEIIRRAAWMR